MEQSFFVSLVCRYTDSVCCYGTGYVSSRRWFCERPGSLVCGSKGCLLSCVYIFTNVNDQIGTPSQILVDDVGIKGVVGGSILSSVLFVDTCNLSFLVLYALCNNLILISKVSVLCCRGEVILLLTNTFPSYY